jgi:hypothetical protein
MGHETHQGHSHQHGTNCGHTAIMHDGHQCFLHDGHMHYVHGDHVDEHKLEVNSKNPAKCTAGQPCGGHEATHRHGPSCGHEPVPHGDHTDYLVSGHLHHDHEGHCDDHGAVQLAAAASR